MTTTSTLPQKPDLSIPTTVNLAPLEGDVSLDAPINQHFGSRAKFTDTSTRAQNLGTSLLLNFFIAGKNKEDQEIYQNIFDSLPPEVPKDQNDWSWVCELPEWESFISTKNKTNEVEFEQLLKAFLGDNRVKTLFVKKPKTLEKAKHMYSLGINR